MTARRLVPFASFSFLSGTTKDSSPLDFHRKPWKGIDMVHFTACLMDGRLSPCLASHSRLCTHQAKLRFFESGSFSDIMDRVKDINKAGAITSFTPSQCSCSHRKTTLFGEHHSPTESSGLETLVKLRFPAVFPFRSEDTKIITTALACPGQHVCLVVVANACSILNTSPT